MLRHCALVEHEFVSFFDVHILVERHCSDEAFYFVLIFSIDCHPKRRSVHRNSIADKAVALHENTDLCALKRNKRHKFFAKVAKRDIDHIGFHWCFLVKLGVNVVGICNKRINETIKNMLQHEKVVVSNVRVRMQSILMV